MDHHHLDNEPFDGTAANNYLNDNQQYNAFDNLFPSHTPSNPNYGESAWVVNGNPYSQHPDLPVTNHQDQTAWSSIAQAQQQQQNLERPYNLETQRASHDHGSRESPLHSSGHYPQSLAFNGYDTQQTFHNFNQQPQYDPSLIQQASQPFKQYSTNVSQSIAQQSTTVAPQALQQDVHAKARLQASLPGSISSPSPDFGRNEATQFDQEALMKQIPPSVNEGMFNVISFDRLVKATNSERLSAFANIAVKPVGWTINRAALPAYVPRKSKNDLKRLAGKDGAALAKLNAKSAKRQKLLARVAKSADSKLALSTNARQAQQDIASSDDDDESDYTSDSDVDESPLPSKRPEGLKDGVEYDTIKALWRSKRRAINAESVRKGLIDFWEVVRTIRDTWKADGEAVTEAEKKDKRAQLPVLKQRVKDQRDMLEVALKTALKHGNRTIIETLSENMSLIFVCYQFLLDRFKADDVNGSLARTMLEFMTTFTTLTNEKLEKTHLVKVLPRYIKNGDAKTQFYAKAITTKAASNTDQARVTAKSAADKAPLTNKSSTSNDKTSTVAGVKRSGSALEDGAAAKRAAVAATKPVGATTTTINGTKKRAADGEVSKPNAKKVATTASSTPMSDDVPKPKSTTSKLTSGLFAGLQSAAKKPGTSVKGTASTVAKDNATKPVTAAPAVAAPAKSVFSFAETMKNLTKSKEEKAEPKQEKVTINETSEQKARRLRREARGPLRVHWRPAEDLIQVREFVHDPEEEVGHDSSQTRDVTDLKGEGRMFKQQHNSKLDIEDEDEDPTAVNAASTDESAMGKMVEWQEPGLVDFTVFKEEDRKANYAPYGGGRLLADSNERLEREKYESSTLSVYYSRFEDIPPDPTEPAEPISGDAVENVMSFGAPEKQYQDRAQTQLQIQRSKSTSQNNIDFNALRGALGSQQPPQAPFLPPFHAASGNAQSGAPDIASIISQLQGNASGAPQPFGQAPTPNWPFAQPPPPVPQAQSSAPPIDIGAILAQLQGNGAPSAPPSMPMPMPMMPPPPAAAGQMPFFADAAQAADFQAFVARQMAAEAAGKAGGVTPQLNAAANNTGGGMYENPERSKLRSSEASATDPDIIAKRKSNSLYKTQVCKFYHEGKCVKGDDCTYLHD